MFPSDPHNEKGEDSTHHTLVHVSFFSFFSIFITSDNPLYCRLSARWRTRGRRRWTVSRPYWRGLTRARASCSEMTYSRSWPTRPTGCCARTSDSSWTACCPGSTAATSRLVHTYCYTRITVSEQTLSFCLQVSFSARPETVLRAGSYKASHTLLWNASGWLWMACCPGSPVATWCFFRTFLITKMYLTQI